MERLRTPTALCFEGNVSEQWRKFKQRFEIFAEATGLSNKPDKVKTCNFLHIAGDEAIEIYNSFKWDDEDDKHKLNKVLEQFEKYCSPRKNITYERHKFFTCNQKQGETIDQYATDLKNKAKSCEFEHLQESLIRDRIVCGIMCDTVRARLLRESELTLNKCIDMCRASEITNSQMKELKQTETDTNINTVKRKTFKPKSSEKQCSTNKRNENCGRCGYTHIKGKCPAYNKDCTKCKRKGHFAKMCKTKKVHAIQEHEQSSDDESEFYLGAIENNTKQSKSKWNTTLRVNDVNITFKIDSGADCNVMSKDTLCNIYSGKIEKSRAKLSVFGGQNLKTSGKVKLPVEHKNKITIQEFQIVDQCVPNVLGLPSCIDLNLIQRIQSVELKNDICEQYQDVFSGFGCIKGVMHHIKLDPSIPSKIHPPRKVPVALRNKLKNELDRLVQLNVVKKVNEPTEWVSSLVTVLKPNGKLRVCLDPLDLNKAIKREQYPMKTIEEVVSRMPNAKVFSKLDCESAFWQIQLDDESSNLCTFNTPFGRYKFTKLPYGIISSSEIFQSVMSEIFDDIDGVDTIVDDLLVWGKDTASHDESLKRVLDRARERNIKLNKDKCTFRMEEVEYIGHTLTKDGLKASPTKVDAIVNMDTPNDKESLRRFMGMITYLSKFIPNLSQISASLRCLLENNTEWHWDQEQQQSFNALTQAVCEAPVLKYFDVNEDIVISVDASSFGVGAVLLQNDQPVAYASKSLTKTQQKYAQIEKEMLSITFGCEKFHQYIYGQKSVEIESDHKPLETIMKKPLHQAPIRLQRMIMRIQKYPLKVNYKRGEELYISDMLSRACTQSPPDTKSEEQFYVNAIAHLPISEGKLRKLQNEVAADPELQVLNDIVMNGWPENKSQVNQVAKKYWNYRDEISQYDGLLFKSNRVIIPKSMCHEMTKLVHSSHLGIDRCKRRARDVIFWVNMNSDIENEVSKCEVCNKYRHNIVKEPLHPHEVPARPWSKVGSDLFFFNNNEYLLLVDYYSGYFEMSKLENTVRETVIHHCKSQFARHGIPDTLISDNGPQYSSLKFKRFVNDYNIKHVTSSPTYPQSNGMAEKAVQTAKNLLKKAKENDQDPYLALLEYRNTPRNDVIGSPVQRLMGRKTKTLIPTHEHLLRPKTLNPETVKRNIDFQKQVQKSYYDRSSKSRELLQPEQSVRMKTPGGWKPAIIQSQCDTPRSYNVVTDGGKTYRRTSNHLLPVKEKHHLKPMDCTIDDNPSSSDNPSSRKPESPKPDIQSSTNPKSVETRSSYGRLIRPPVKYSSEEFV